MAVIVCCNAENDHATALPVGNTDAGVSSGIETR
jgi:hypothetical protein